MYKRQNYKVIGSTIKDGVIKCEEYDFEVSLQELEKAYEEKLEYVFKSKTEDKEAVSYTHLSDYLESKGHDISSYEDEGKKAYKKLLKTYICLLYTSRCV